MESRFIMRKFLILRSIWKFQSSLYWSIYIEMIVCLDSIEVYYCLHEREHIGEKNKQKPLNRYGEVKKRNLSKHFSNNFQRNWSAANSKNHLNKQV